MSKKIVSFSKILTVILLTMAVAGSGCKKEASTSDTTASAGKKNPGKKTCCPPASGDKGKCPVTQKDGAKTEDPKGTADEVPLKLELPKPVFMGTPKNIEAKNLDKTLPKNIPSVNVPSDVKNVAFEKMVTSSEEEPFIGDLEQVTDGDKEGVDGSYVELGPGLQWIQIDLEKDCNIYAIALWHYHGEGRVYHDVVVQISTDPDFIENVTVFNNDYDNSSGKGIGKDLQYIETNYGRQISVKGVKGRYIRMFSQGNTSNDQNHYTEVEVYGKAAG